MDKGFSVGRHDHTLSRRSRSPSATALVHGPTPIHRPTARDFSVVPALLFDMDAESSPAGYVTDFLGRSVPLPVPGAGTPVRELAYTHFTVLLDPSRRLAVVTGVNIDGDQLVDVPRGDDWHLDARLPVHEQTGEAVYANNDLDRGHLVRRRDPVWGSESAARQANRDTFAYTNAAPQAAEFNQSKHLWLGLEDHVWNYARTNENRISVFTAPVLTAEDPLYRGVEIPQSFWKIAAWTSLEENIVILHAAGFVLDQSAQLSEIELGTAQALARIQGSPPPLGPYRTYQVPVAEIIRLTGVAMPELAEADVLAPVLALGAADGSRQHWIELVDLSAIQV